MNILVIEDNPERIKWFKSNLLPSNEMWIAIESRLAMRLVEEVDFDLIFFDHDLGGLENIDSQDENTGYRVAKYMKDNNFNTNTKMIIHSLNRYGALNIHSLFPKSLICPFTLLKHLFDINKPDFGISSVTNSLPIRLN